MELRRLSVLFGGMSYWDSACVFVWGLSDKAKCLLRTLTQMDNLSIDQLWAHVWVIMKDKVIEKGMVVTAVWTTLNNLEELSYGPISCHCCNISIILQRTVTPEGVIPGQDVISSIWWAVYPIIVWEMSRGNRP